MATDEILVMVPVEIDDFFADHPEPKDDKSIEYWKWRAKVWTFLRNRNRRIGKPEIAETDEKMRQYAMKRVKALRKG